MIENGFGLNGIIHLQRDYPKILTINTIPKEMRECLIKKGPPQDKMMLGN